MSAERDLARRLTFVGIADPDPCLEPLTISVHQRDEGERHLRQLARERGDVVEPRLGLRVEDAATSEDLEASLLVDG